jgi:taurine dioxygenase
MLQIDPLANQMAARIGGLDLSRPLAPADWKAIKTAWQEFHVLVFPGQPDLSVEAHVALLARFGTVLEERMPGDQHSFVSNNEGLGTDEMNDGYREGPLTPHMDYTYTPYPADVISLFATALPETGSQTLFYDNVAPLGRMPSALRNEIAEYTIFCAHDLKRMQPDARPYLDGRTDPAAPTQSHEWPMVRQHPRKPGVEALMSTLQQTERIIELSDLDTQDAKSRAVLDTIFNEYLYVDENRYVHDWQLGDLVVWDNVAVQHAREACPLTRGARSFRRVACCEAGNAIQNTVAFLGLTDSSVAFS